jgi:hypothetical protein
MSDIVKPNIEDFADINDYFVALDEYYEALLHSGLTVTAA